MILGLIEAVREAKEEGSPMAMIAAYREIGKMLGYYNQPVTSALQDCNESLMRSMSDGDLIQLLRRPQEGAGKDVSNYVVTLMYICTS